MEEATRTTGRQRGIAIASGAAICLAALCLVGVASLRPEAAERGPAATVSQRTRTFSPAIVTIGKGDTVAVVNDDAPAVHHVYVDDDRFRFDSGDQAPGSRTDIRFTEAGDFQVLCGVHPRMRMTVRVRERTAEAR